MNAASAPSYFSFVGAGAHEQPHAGAAAATLTAPARRAGIQWRITATVPAPLCRLFGMHSGREPVTAQFWLLDAPGALVLQSCGNPDGFGIGTFEPDGSPDVDK